MHLSEGVLHTPVLLAGVALAVVGVAVGLHRLESERLPLTALFAAAFFVAGTIHVPVGIGSVVGRYSQPFLLRCCCKCCSFPSAVLLC